MQRENSYLPLAPIDDGVCGFSETAKKLHNSGAFVAISSICMFVALFGGSLFEYLDVPDDPGTLYQDALMTSVTCFFIFEVLVRTVADRGYVCSFFFWMDMIGTTSMVFEVSYLLGLNGHEVSDFSSGGLNPVFARAARAARIGARAARLTRLIKCFACMGRLATACIGRSDFHVHEDEDKKGAPEYDAHVLKNRLKQSLSAKVAMLTVGLVVGMPMLSIGRYPEADYSMESWSRTLSLSYETSVHEAKVGGKNHVAAKLFSESVTEMQQFYETLSYFPFKLEGFPTTIRIDDHGVVRNVSIPGGPPIQGDLPARLQNVRIVKFSQCRVGGKCGDGAQGTMLFNFTTANARCAAGDMLIILFVVTLMVLETFTLSRMIDSMVVKPIEKMLGTVQMMAKVLRSVVDPGKQMNNISHGPTSPKSAKSVADVSRVTTRADLVSSINTSSRSSVLPKSRLSQQALENEDEEYETLETEESFSEANLLQDVFAKLLGLVAEFYKKGMVELEQMDDLEHESKGVLVEIMMLDHGHHKYQNVISTPVHGIRTSEVAVKGMTISPETIQSWDLNVLDMSHVHQMQVVAWILFDSELSENTARKWFDLRTFERFHEHVRQEYHATNPYHNYAHACDVVSTVYRWFRMNQVPSWLDEIDQLAILLSALAHDIGHPGKTAPFLMETRHELAIRYNDKSPLENMHCAKLFEITKKEAFAIFATFDNSMFKKLRKTCINAIIHTDNALHFDMVKAVGSTYSQVSDFCDVQSNSGDVLMDSYKENVLQKKEHLEMWQQLILHLCDISTPLKPFHVSKRWARCVQDEFFAQGDEEKRLEIPVGFLNDRVKVNRNSSEHGFIVFLVSPLTIGATRIFPMMQPLAEEMLKNVSSWRDAWIEDTKPSEEDIGKKDQDIQKLQEQIVALAKREMGTTIRTN